MLSSALFVTALLAPGAAQADAPDGEQLLREKCSVCHLLVRPTKELAPHMLAPPMMGVMYHVKTGIEVDGPDREAVIAFITDYVHHPDREKSLCKDRAIERFGLMPSLRAAVTTEQLTVIAGYLYDHFPPSDFQHGAAKEAVHADRTAQ